MVQPPDPAVIVLVMMAFIAGMAVPTADGLERMAGFGRWFASKLPYKPRAGMDPVESMEQAVDTAEGTDSE